MNKLFHFHKWDYFLSMEWNKNPLRICKCGTTQVQVFDGIATWLWKDITILGRFGGVIWIITSTQYNFAAMRKTLCELYNLSEEDFHALLNEEDWDLFVETIRSGNRPRMVLSLSDWWETPFLTRMEFGEALSANVPAIIFPAHEQD